jgi:hypothetical protein
MKHIRLDNHHEYVVSDSAYPQIEVMVEANLVCETCEKPYTPERPQVARNRCLPCFLRFHQSNPLHYVGVVKTESKTPVHGFLDAVGYLCPSTSEDDVRSLNQSKTYTLKYFGYPVPSHILLESETEERRLESGGWQIHGDFRNGQAVLVLEYTQPYGDHFKLFFLSYRNGEADLLDKRRGQGRKWFIEAKKTIEATRVGREYRWKGRGSYQIFNSDIYELVSELASAQYAARQKGA